jgi:hypothetical protein
MTKQLRVVLIDKKGALNVCKPGDQKVKEVGVKISATGETWSAPNATEPETNKEDIPVGTMRLMDDSFQNGALIVFSLNYPTHLKKSYEAVAEFYKRYKTS